MSVSREYLQSLFDYRDGELYWKAPRAGVTVGARAGWANDDGYRRIQLDGKNVGIHRLIFMMHHGYLPKYIDHIDNNRSNNSIENLRECTQQQNLQNQTLRKDSKSGVKNVSWSPRHKSWTVLVKNGSKFYRKYIKDLELADLVAQEARNKFHGKFANHGYKEQIA
jgi:hypothetical protein